MLTAIGAKQGLWHATVHLIAADPAQREALLEENNRRLDELSSTLDTTERNSFELNKYREREWRWRSRTDQIMRLRAGRPGSGWLARIRARSQ
jgi:hypothetical protein